MFFLIILIIGTDGGGRHLDHFRRLPDLLRIWRAFYRLFLQHFLDWLDPVLDGVCRRRSHRTRIRPRALEIAAHCWQLRYCLWPHDAVAVPRLLTSFARTRLRRWYGRRLPLRPSPSYLDAVLQYSAWTRCRYSSYWQLNRWRYLPGHVY